MAGGERKFEYRLGDGVRRRLRAIAHEIYDRLVMEEHVEENNRAENSLTLLLYSAIGLATGATAFLLAAVGAKSLGLALPVEPLPAAIGAGFAAVLLANVLLGRAISDTGLRAVGRATIYGWRRTPGRKSRERRREMLRTIEEWLRSNPEKPAREVEQRFGQPARRVLPRALVARLDSMNRRKGAPDYLLFVGLFERKYKAVYGLQWFRSRRPKDDPEGFVDYYVRARTLRNALKINLILHALGADLRDETPDGDDWKREYYTQPGGQQLTLWDEHDLPVRFRTFSPHLRWPRDGDMRQPSSVGEAPTFVAIEGVENPLQIPLWLLTVDDVVAAMPIVAPNIYERVRTGEMTREKARDEAVATMLRKPVPMFAKKDRNTLRALGGVDAPEITVMRENDGVLELRWDPNRILWDRLDPAANADLLQALALTLAAIDWCARNESGAGPRARRVTLSRGDVLLTDNQRTLVCRRETDFLTDDRRLKLAARMPPQWWLRGYYGFRTPPETAERRRTGGAPA